MRSTATAARLVVPLLALGLVVGPATTASAQNGSSGRIADIGVEQGSVQFLYTTAGLPEGVGLDPDSLQVAFQPTGEDPIPLDNPQAQPLDEQPELVRQTAVLAVDTSGSLQEAGMAAVRDAATTFLDAVPDQVEVGLVTFGDPAVVVQEPTTDHALVQESIDGLVDEGGTALYDATIAAIDLLPDDGSRRVVVLTDGRDESADGASTGSDATLQDAADRVAAAGADLVAVAFGAGASQEELQTLATAGQGQVVDADEAEALAGAFEAVADSIATDLVVTVDVPEELAGRRGNLVVSAQAGEQVLQTAAFVTLASAAATPPDAQPSVEPSDVAAAPLPQSVPPLTVRIGTPLLYGGLAGLFVALLVIAVVLVGLLSRRNSPEAQRRRSLSVYSMKGAAGTNPRLVGREDPQATKLGNNAVARSAVELAGRAVQSRDASDRLARTLDAASIPLRPAEWVVLRVAIPAAAGILLLLLSQGNVLAMLLGVVLGVIGPPVFLGVRRSRREKAFVAIMPDTLALMASGLRAGYSMPQAMDSVVREGREPIRSEFNRALVEARLGVPPEDAMEGIAERMRSQDFRWVVMAIRIQREVGGNLAELLDTVAQTLRERSRLRRMVDTLSAEGRLSAWILGLLPVAFCGYLLLVQPEYLAPLYSEPLGILLLVVALVVFGIGVLGLRWAIKVEV